jgi:putative endonuclease
MTNKQSLTQRAEDAAAAYLERVNIAVVERRWKCDLGMADVVAWEANTLVFVDVKVHRAERSEAMEAVSPATKRRMTRVAQAYMQSVGLDNIPWRFDRIDLLVISADRALLRHTRHLLEQIG